MTNQIAARRGPPSSRTPPPLAFESVNTALRSVPDVATRPATARKANSRPATGERTRAPVARREGVEQRLQILAAELPPSITAFDPGAWVDSLAANRERFLLADKEAEFQRARHLAEHDRLTALPQVHVLLQKLDTAMKLGVKVQHGLAVLHIGIDGVAAFAQLHGRDAGDDLLKMVAARLRWRARENDVLCHLGAGQFACLVVGLPKRQQLQRLAEKLAASIVGLQLPSGEACDLQGHVGIALCPAAGLVARQLLAHSEGAKAVAKSGGLTTAFFEPVGTDDGE